MDTDCSKLMSFNEAPDIPGCDYRTVQPLALKKPWHAAMMVEEESITNVLIEVEANRQAESGNLYSVAETKGNYPVLIDFEKIWLWDHHGGLKVDIRMKDPDYNMKRRLMEWVRAVAAYVRFLHASSHADSRNTELNMPDNIPTWFLYSSVHADHCQYR